MRNDLILRVGGKLILPFILLFALYVHFHGDYGPGGGFQGGAIAAGMVILYAIMFGLYAAKRAVPPKLVARMIPAGVLIFAGAGLPGMFAGRNYLDYTVFAHDHAHAHEYGIIIVEFGVLITVFATMLAIFYAFVDRGRS